MVSRLARPGCIVALSLNIGGTASLVAPSCFQAYYTRETRHSTDQKSAVARAQQGQAIN